MSAGPMLRVAGLSKRFGAVVVSEDIDLEVRPGELHALIGPNGAGKTTLIHQITGRLFPDRGRVFFDGQDVTGLPMHARARRGLARSFQITAIVKTLTVLENVALAVQARSGSSYRFFAAVAREQALHDAAHAALERVGLGARTGVPAGRLSYGEKRGLELAMALAMAPKLLVLDEPLAGTGREEARGLIDTLQSLKGTYPMLLVEHDMHAVFALADRISVLVYGRVVCSGTPDVIRADAGVRAAYLGSQEI